MYLITLGLAVVCFLAWLYFSQIAYPEENSDLFMICTQIWLVATIVVIALN